jgi:uncharacterized membrane-anchored protein YhcB (DUF1043 family)
MIQQFKKWLTVGTVNSKFNLFKFAIIGELILIIGLVICLFSIKSLKNERDALQEKIHNQKETLHNQEETLNHYNENILAPLGLWETY